MRKSLGILKEYANTVTFGTHVPYAATHNFGLRVRAVQNVRAHTRYRNGKAEQVKAHTRKMDTQFKKRQFIGESHQMMENLDQWLLNQIKERFKQH